MSEFTYREYRRPGDAEALLRMRNAIFPPLTVEEWLRDESQTAAMAFDGETCVGAIPLSLRDFQMAPGVVIRTAFENAVGTREDLRSRGVGTGMINAAREFLRDRCEALMVYRGGERSIGYNFYWKTLHRDLLFIRQAQLAEPSDTGAVCAVTDLASIFQAEERLTELFQSTYASYGGFPPRGPGYWRRALAGQIYVVLPQETLLVRWPDTDDFRAYAILGIRKGAQGNQQLQVLEIASEEGRPDHALQVVRGVAGYAAKRRLTVGVSTNWEHPFRDVFRAAGFEEGPRWMMVMGQPIRPEALFDKLCRDRQALSDLRIKVWTPTTDSVLYEGPEARTEITIEGKDSEMWRLLVCRLPLAEAVRSERLTIQNGTDEIVQRLDAVWPFAPWAYHHLDYI